MGRLLVIDATSIASRAWAIGIPGTFFSMVDRVYLSWRPNWVVFCFDDPTEPSWRRELLPEYKNRSDDSDRREFCWDLCKTLRYHGYTVYTMAEGDDAVASVACSAAQQGIRVWVFSGDKDLLALMSVPGVDVVGFERNTQLDKYEKVIYHEADAQQIFGAPSDRITDYKALAGDTSDTYKGVPGVGPKTAAELIAVYGPLEAIIAAAELIVNGQAPEPPWPVHGHYASKIVLHQETARTTYQVAELDKGAAMFSIPDTAGYDRRGMQVVATGFIPKWSKSDD